MGKSQNKLTARIGSVNPQISDLALKHVFKESRKTFPLPVLFEPGIGSCCVTSSSGSFVHNIHSRRLDLFI